MTRTATNNRAILFRLVAGIAFTACALPVFAQDPASEPQSHGFLDRSQREMLNELLDTHLNYFLASEIITESGLPVTAYRPGSPGRFTHSNSTEWAYALQAWIAAATFEKITLDEAAARLRLALTTIDRLQTTEGQHLNGMLYQFYWVRNPDGSDRMPPIHDYLEVIPSVDNAFLWSALNIVEGWALRHDLFDVAALSRRIRGRMDFSIFLTPDGFIAHLVKVSTGELVGRWDVAGDEGGAVVMIAYLSGTIDFSRFQLLAGNQMRRPATYNGITVAEPGWFGSAFTLTARPLSGIPIGGWELDDAPQRFARESLIPAVRAHFAFADALGAYYPGWSEPASLPSGPDRPVPPNLAGEVPTSIQEPAIAAPHALFVGLLAGPELNIELRDLIIDRIDDLKDDTAQYYHGSDSPTPWGFETVVSPHQNDTSFSGIEARPNFETLNHGYIALSLYQALATDDAIDFVFEERVRRIERPTWFQFAARVPGYVGNLRKALKFLYPESRKGSLIRVPQDFTSVQGAIDAVESGDSIQIAPGTYRESISIRNRRDLTIRGTRGAILTGGQQRRILSIRNSEVVIEDLTIEGGGAEEPEEGASLFLVDSIAALRRLTITDANANSTGVRGTGGAVHILRSEVLLADSTLTNNRAWLAGGCISIRDSDNVSIIGNRLEGCNADWAGAIYSRNSSPTIARNLFLRNIADHRHSGAILMNGGAGLVSNNTFVENRAQVDPSAISSSEGSQVRIVNNIFAGRVFAGRPFGTALECSDAAPQISYNLFHENQAAVGGGCILDNSSITADPQFRSPQSGDYSLGLLSPAVNRGDPSAAFRDADGSRNDMGFTGGPSARTSSFAVDAATFSSGPIAPGTLVNVLAIGLQGADQDGLFPSTQLADGTGVLFNGLPAPIVASVLSRQTLTVLAPHELPTTGEVAVQIRNQEGASPPAFRDLTPARPAVFRVAGDYAAATLANTAWLAISDSAARQVGLPPCVDAAPASYCHRSISPGEPLTIYLTGLGPVTPPIASATTAAANGSPLHRSISQPIVRVGGVAATVLYSGLVPGFNGLYQIDVVVDPSTVTGLNTPLAVEASGHRDTVMVSVQP